MANPKRVLVTAGHTIVMIDTVRGITNIFEGRTGTAIAFGLYDVDGMGKKIRDNYEVTLVTSNPSLYYEHIYKEFGLRYVGYGVSNPCMCKYKTFSELATVMEREIRSGSYDAVIHSAAVSDYEPVKVLIPGLNGLEPIDASKKVSGSYPEVYVKMVPTFKIIDRIREPWGFKGKLIKFKLQVGISDAELIAIARDSMVASRSDYIVANCFEWAKERAYIIGADGSCENVTRANLPAAIKERL